MSAVPASARSVAVVTLGCARNEVDSEELAGRLGRAGWRLDADAENADVVLVNTCGFIESAKKDSIDTLLAAADTGRKVVAVGCLAERYGDQLAAALPEADAVLGFDSYADIAARLDDVAHGRALPAHVPRDRRTLLPIAPADRPTADVMTPGHDWVTATRARLDDAPMAYLKLASGCDRRCSFCAIPSFRGAFVSRPPSEVLAEARWLADTGVRELVLVSENSTSYGKDLGDLRALERLLAQLVDVDGVDRVRVSYLQPAELRPDLIRAIAATPGVAPYFDLSFQHASATVLRRMRRFGSGDSFLDLLDLARGINPELGARSNFIVGFPGETERDLADLEAFLSTARLDAIGVFGYSDEDGTAAAGFDDKLAPEVVAERVERVAALADELVAQRAEDRVGTLVEVLVESIEPAEPADVVTLGALAAGGGERFVPVGRGAHQGPDVDGVVRLIVADGAPQARPGQLVRVIVTGVDGADLLASCDGQPW